MTDTKCTTRTSETASPAACPPWCTDHTGFDDGSDDGHQSSRHHAGKHWLYLSTGTLSGDVELFMDDREGISLEEAQALAEALLAAIKKARG